MMAVKDMDVLNAITKILYPTVAKISDDIKPRRTGNSTCHRGGMEPRKDGYDRCTFRLYSKQWKRKTDKFRIYRADRRHDPAGIQTWKIRENTMKILCITEKMRYNICNSSSENAA